MPVLKMTESGVIKNLTQQEFAEVNFASGKTLTIEENFALPASKQMNISGDAGVLKTSGIVSLAGTLSVSGANPSLEGGTVALSGGTLQADNDITVKSDLTSQADSSISVAAGKTITYTGSGINVGNHSLKVSGGGTLDNTNNLTIDNAGSKLSISDSTKVSRMLVSASGTGNGITISDSAANFTGNLVENLQLSSSLSVTSDVAWSVGSITAGSALTFSNDKDLSVGSLSLSGSAEMSLGTSDITVSVTNPVSAGSTQIIRNGGGSFKFIGGLTLASGSELIVQGQKVSGDIVLNGGKVTVEKNTEFPGNISVSADSTIHIDSSKALTYGGQAIDIGASKLKIQGGGSFVTGNHSDKA